jgi:hypothetical protein
MKLLPSIESPDLYGWIVLLIMLAAAVLSALAVYVWSVLFPKKRRHKSRRRRGYSPPNPEVARTNGAPSALDREHAPGEPRS